MALEIFTAASLATIDDGRIKAAIDRHIRDVANDIDDRGQDGETRTVTVTLAFKPMSAAGEVYETVAEISVQSKLPPRRSKPYSMACKPGKQGAAFIFNEVSADNVKQQTLDNPE